MGLTFGGRGRDLGGYLHLGHDRGRSRLYGTLLYDRDHRRQFGSRYYPRGHYYHLYYPIHYFGHDYYSPWHGYTYSSVYYQEPYVYQFYDKDVYYVDEVREPADRVMGERPESEAVVEGQATPDVVYQTLTEPSENTLIGRGNAAFFAGLYEEARRYYVSGVLADERDGYAKFLYALVNFATGDYDVAGMALRRALLTTPELIDYPPDIRGLYANAGVLDGQLGALTRFAKDQPRDRNAGFLLAYLQLTRGDATGALEILTRLADADEGDQLVTLLRDAIVRIQAGRSLGE